MAESIDPHLHQTTDPHGSPPSVELHLPRSLVELFPGAPRRLWLEATSVAALIRELDRRWPGMWDRLCEAGPAVREHITVFVDGEPALLDTPLHPQAVVRVIPAVSGGEGG